MSADPDTDAFVEALELSGAACPTDETRFACVGYSLSYLRRKGWTISPPPEDGPKRMAQEVLDFGAAS